MTPSSALEAGAFVDALDDSGASPLLLAASQKDFTMAPWGVWEWTSRLR